MSNTISAVSNPDLANNLIKDALKETPVDINPTIVPPSDTTVALPGGYVTTAGELLQTAEVRELTGRDEEVISKAANVGKALLVILERGTVKVGDLKADDKILDHMLTGDREALLLGILKATFGTTTDMSIFCGGCNDFKNVTVDINEDIKTKVLADPIADRVFTVQGKAGDIEVQLPTGIAQKELINNADKTSAEMNTILLEKTVLKINNSPVYSKIQVQNLPVVDRKKIIEEINRRVPGPQFDDVTMECPDCGSEVTVSINLGTLFQF
jgi:hypothetical protein